MSIILFDQKSLRKSLLPLTFTRPIADIRVGILKIAEKWRKHLDEEVSYLTEDYLQVKFPLQTESENLFINGALCPSTKVIATVKELKVGQILKSADYLLAFRGTLEQVTELLEQENLETANAVEYSSDFTLITGPWDIFRKNADGIKSDFNLITKNRKSQKISDPHTITYSPDNIFIEEGADIKASILNATSGPIYIGKNARIEENCVVKGSFALCESGHLNVGAKIRGDTTIGPHCKVGGEVSNSVLFGYSNKGHEGFLGNSVLGEWCNLGADTNTSNLKNNYANVKIWNYDKGGFKDTGLQFCGLIAGDHSKSGINTMFNTGTVVGVSANIFGAGYPRTFIPSFSWGGASGFKTYLPKKAFEVADLVMQRRAKKFDQVEEYILSKVFEDTAKFRIWENAK